MNSDPIKLVVNDTTFLLLHFHAAILESETSEYDREELLQYWNELFRILQLEA